MHIVRELGYSIKERPLHEAIILGRICNKGQWLTDAYITLITAKDPLDLVNLAQKGIDNDTIAKLFRAREHIGSTKFTSPQEKERAVEKDVFMRFDEIAEMEVGQCHRIA